MIFVKLVFLLTILQCSWAMLCNEDAHCSEDFFCELPAHSCRKCYKCYEFNRNQPADEDTCVKTGDECGPCFENFVKYFKWSKKCVPPYKEERVWPLLSYGYYWLTWIFIACVVSAIFIKVILNTNIVKIVGYHNDNSTSVQDHYFDQNVIKLIKIIGTEEIIVF